MFWIVLIITVVIDQLSKFLVAANMRLGQQIPVLGDFFSLNYIINTGASFSMLSGKRWLLIIITLVVLLVVFYFLSRIPNDYRRLRIAIAVFCGGTIGNLIDRVLNGGVVDFLHLYFKGFDYHFPTFNLADCFIDVAVVAILLMLFFGREKRLLED